MVEMFEILIYIIDLPRPISIVGEITNHLCDSRSGMSQSISFRDVKGREGTVLLNPDKVVAVVMSPVDEPG
jgi:hypothetical protein